MIPILYDKTETSFTSNGLGRLTDCLRCIVTEERNGVYECEFDYPISGDKYSLIQEGQIIAVTHDDNGDIQPFDIYHRTAPINGIVTFYARHISYRQIGITVQPFTASGVANAIAGIKTNSLGTNPFTYSTNKTTAGDYTVSVPSSAKALLGGEGNSLLDVFGAGEYEFDKFSVKLWTRRGTDTDVEIRYGKNLSDIEHDVDYSEAYNGVVPYWYGTVVDENTQTEVETLVTLPEWSVMASGATYDGRDTVLPLDLSGEFDEPPSENDLRTLATQKLNEADTLLPIDNLTVSFVQLWQTDEYKNIAPLQKVKLCDTVHVIFPELGVNKTAVKVIKTVYNTLLDRYDEMELGDRLSSYASIVTANNTSAIAQLEDGLLIVSGAANQALIDADVAHDAAIIAQGAAGDAQAAADAAEGHAQTALTNAGLAQTAADSAQRDATAAGKAANGALSSLSVVEDVLGVLNWVSEHGTYAATSDTEVVPGKFYFTRSGTAPDYIYTVVLNPSGDPSAQGYYELTGTDEAVSHYVSSHLALTSAGLYVINDNNSYKILLASDGMYVYDELGALVSKFGQSITFSDIRPQTIGNTTNYIKFYDSNTDGIADSIEISGSNVNIASSVTIGGQPQSDYLNSSLIDLKTATGSMVSFSDGADYPAQDVTTTIEPIQAGTGTPSPSNPRAISGHTEVVVSRTGKNLFDNVYESGIINGTTGQNSSNSNYQRSANYTRVVGGKKYTFKYKTATVNILLYQYDKNRVYLQSDAVSIANGGSHTMLANTAFIRVRPYGNISTVGDSPALQIEEGPTATAYEAFGDTYTTALGTTVYGGTLDVTTGVLTVTHGYTTISDIGSTIGYNANGYFYGSITGKAVGNWNLISSAYKTTSGDSVGVMNDGEIKGNATTTNIYIKDSNYTDASAFKTARGSVQIVYELATPLTVNLTAQQIQILTGTNNIWSSTGDSTVEYVVGSGDMLDALTNVSANKYITQIGEDGIKVHAVNDSSYVGITSHAITMSDGTRTLYEVASTSGAVKLTRVYNAEFVQAHDDVPPSSQTDTIELGRTVDTWVSTILTYTVSGTTYTRTYNSLPISVTSGEEFTLEVSRVGTVLSVEYGMKTTGYAGDSITIDSLEFNFTTTQPVIESTIGGYADKTMSGAFRVGNGTADNALSNALLVDWTGRGMFSGDVIANCDSDSSGGVSLSSVSYEPWAWVTYNDSIPYFLSVDVARVGMLATLTVTFERPTSIASGTDLFKVSLANAPIPKPMLENSVTGATFYGGHILGLVLEFDNDLNVWVIRVRNASSSAVTVSSSVGTLTYITDGTLTKDYVPTP